MQREISRTGRTFGGSFDTQEENDVVRIYNDSTYSPPKLAGVCLVYVARIGMWKQTYVDAIIDHLSVLRRAIFFE